MPETQHFRANVGIVVIDDDGRVLALERSDAPGAWQLPQGGLEVGEEPLAAALRELEEETGILPEHVAVVAEHPDWLAYEWPAQLRRDGRRGQVQRWFVLRATTAAQVDLAASEEFVDHRFLAMEDLLAIVHPMRRATYARIAPWVREVTGHRAG